MVSLTAKQFVTKLRACQSDEELIKYQRSFKFDKDNQAEDDYFIGVKMGLVFELAKAFIDLPLDEVEILLESPVHEVRAGGMSVMDFQARRKNTPEARRKEIYDLYLRRHDRINNWDLVDRAAPHVIGGYLYEFDQPRTILYELAKSKNPWERRTSIYSTFYFIRKGELDDTFAIAKLLMNDEHELIQKASGAWLREAGKQDLPKLTSFLDQHASAMPKVMLRHATEKLSDAEKKYYRNRVT